MSAMMDVTAWTPTGLLLAAMCAMSLVDDAFASPRSPSARLVQGRTHLEAHRYELARRTLREVAEEGGPGAVAARVGWSIAASNLGECDEAAQAVATYFGHRAMKAEVGADLAQCYLEQGRLGEAEEWTLTYLRRWPRSPRLNLLGLMIAMEAGDLPTATQALAVLDWVDGDREWWAAGRALTLTGTTGQDAALYEATRLARDPWVVTTLAIADAQAWLRVGDPIRAADLLLPFAVRDLRSLPVAAARAEALRRAGRMTEAEFVFERVARRPGAMPDALLAARARWHADSGRITAARADLAELRTVWHADAVAARWYVEHIDPAGDAQPWAAWYEIVRRPQDVPLEALRPPGSPTTPGARE